MVSRPYSHKVVALFAISCGIMEKQLEILNSLETIDGILDGVESNPFDRIEPDDLVDPYFIGRGLNENLEFANTFDILGEGDYSKMTDMRKTRNRLVHNPVFRLSIESYLAHRQKIKKAVDAPNRLDELIENSLAKSNISESS